MRGEHVDEIDVAYSRGGGSSPHARGAPYADPISSFCAGIIPACAGSTRTQCRRLLGRPDHPRMRGEHCDNTAFSTTSSGSSPHARGAPELRLHRHYRRGSSPHARGAHRPIYNGNEGARIIPACAGSTNLGESQDLQLGDHPRMRGEHRPARIWCWGSQGSSPHARGAPSRRGLNLDTVGIIPACAGSTTRRPARIWCWGDHPRMRGEHACVSRPEHDNSGSSPHARGARAA